MFLYARKYVTNFLSDADIDKNSKIRELIGASKYEGSLSVEVEVAYWRKANQIHAWFVDNVQYGVDNCSTYHVGRGHIEKLRDACRKALENRDSSVLQPRDGFFFGSTEIDDYYWQDVEYTEDIMTRLLDDSSLDKFDFFYHASW